MCRMMPGLCIEILLQWPRIYQTIDKSSSGEVRIILDIPHKSQNSHFLELHQ